MKRSSDRSVDLNVITMAGSSCHLTARLDSTVRSLKHFLVPLVGAPAYCQQLLFEDNEMEDGVLLDDLLPNDAKSAIDLCMVLRSEFTEEELEEIEEAFFLFDRWDTGRIPLKDALSVMRALGRTPPTDLHEYEGCVVKPGETDTSIEFEDMLCIASRANLADSLPAASVASAFRGL
eukprot:TRINITY_DN3056_c0_g1_i3.p1 TRINITY_DN3056_c0_g1~~TRINITY_DN3056_c0_g1_i3.p1  ORF type:complete len:177 (-),score=16.96 TRINITY_DN3056_c0_g1_i3:20-550(-)